MEPRPTELPASRTSTAFDTVCPATIGTMAPEPVPMLAVAVALAGPPVPTGEAELAQTVPRLL